MTKESEKDITVEMFINNKVISVKNPIQFEFNDTEDTLTVSFMIGTKKLDKVKLIFKELTYIDGEEIIDN